MPTKVKVSQKLKDLAEKLSYRQYLILAFIVSCLMGLIFYLSLPGDNKPKEQVAVAPAAGNTVPVVVAKVDIPKQAVIKPNMLKTVDVPENAVPAGAIKNVNDIINRPASVPIQQGDTITDRKFYADPKMAGFIGMIPPDCRAISVGISDVTGIAGFARPGDYVDIMLIKDKSKNGRISGEILLQNVMLLGLNKNANPPKVEGAPNNQGENGQDGKNQEQQQQQKEQEKDKDKKDKKNQDSGVQASGEAMSIATFALTPEEALQLAVALKEGQIYLVLRPLQPKDMFVLNTEYSMASNEETPRPTQSSQPVQPVRPTPSVPAVAASPAPVAPSYQTTVEVIRGVEASNVGVND